MKVVIKIQCLLLFQNAPGNRLLSSELSLNYFLVYLIGEKG